MEYVEGAPLKCPLATEEATRLAIQIASRWRKPTRKGSFTATSSPATSWLPGRVMWKLLDFGLAKTTGSASAAMSDGGLTRSMTQEGVIVGTLQYMSPEQMQKEGSRCPKRYFSFGAVRYELLTNRPAFHAPNPASTVAAILTSQPVPVSDLGAALAAGPRSPPQKMPAEGSGEPMAVRADLRKRH